MRRLLFSVLFLIFLSACVHKPFMKPVCRHTSILCAITVGEKYPVRIVYGETWFDEHAEAQAFIKGKWRRLRFDNGEIEIVEKETYWIVIYKEHVTVEEALKWSTKKFK